MKRRQFLLLTLCVSLIPTVHAQTAGTYDFTPLDTIISGWMSRGYYPGGAIAVAKDDRIIFSKNYGKADGETQVYVASAGKWVAAATVAAVVDRTALDWDDPAERWIPSYRNDPKGKITLRHLLSHTSGVLPYQPRPRVDNHNELALSVAEILPLDTVFGQGRRFQYGGLGMQIAGRMAELAAGAPFETLFQRYIAAPLGMRRSHFTPVNTDGGHAPMLGGGLCTTLNDYMRFLKMIFHMGVFEGRRVLSAASVTEMEADQVKDAEVGAGEFVERGWGLRHRGIYGLGLWRELVGGDGRALQVSSPGWAGAYPWLNRQEGIYGFFIAHVQGGSSREGFSSFYGSPVISRTVADIVSPSSLSHPRLYVSASERDVIRRRIRETDWAGKAFTRIRNEVERYADRHMEDSLWIVSRMAMYWKDGARYTQCYLKDQTWERGEGNAPVPTVRMPGMRVWNEYANVPLEDRIPYNESGDMMGVSRLHPDAKPVLVPYRKSGHMIRGNNVEILTLAEKASFVYWLTGKEKFAKFAADIFNTWLVGTYYMNPILDPGKSGGGEGGWKPGGILGYYDYEQIHDDLALHAATVYDFLFDYLQAHPAPHLKQIGKREKDVAEEVFKRFIDLGLIRGGRDGNWNVNGWNVILRPILVLDADNAYADGHGRQYYLNYLLRQSTDHHVCLPDMLKNYDAVTGLWPESPGYSFSTVQMLLDWSVMLRRMGIDIVETNPKLQKAALAMLPWMDGRANMVVFGDSRGGAANFLTLENLLSYYTVLGDSSGLKKVAGALNKGIAMGKYRREEADWTGICSFADPIPDGGPTAEDRASYSPHHRFIVMKNGPLMATLYGGRKGYHLSANGLAVQLYGHGYALVPDAAAYESYWSKDYQYHQSATGANTILPGYTEGDIEVNAMEPMPARNAFSTDRAVSPWINFADVTAAEKRRTVVLIRTSDEGGYYVDLFRSDQDSNDWLFHHVGDGMQMRGKGLKWTAVDSIGRARSGGYSFFRNVSRTQTANGFQCEWGLPEGIISRLWMTGDRHREVFRMDAPSTTMVRGLTPGDVSMPPHPTPALMVRQTGLNGREHPFCAVYESVRNSQPDIIAVETLRARSGRALTVRRRQEQTETILSAELDRQTVETAGIRLSGMFGVVARHGRRVTAAYLGNGRSIITDDVSITAGQPVYASVWQAGDVWYAASTGPAVVHIGSRSYVVDSSVGKKLE